MSQQLSDILDVIRACAAGDTEARHRFQEAYGEDIYNFPVKIYGLPLDEAGDFYVYVFDKDRIFARLKTFAGRNNIQFRTFLSYYVLKSLFFEWLRTAKEVETISLHTPLGNSREGEATLEDVLADDRSVEVAEEAPRREELETEFWSSLGSEEQLDVKLLYLLECELEPEDLRLLVNISGRSVIDTLTLVAEVRDGLKQKDEKVSRLRDELGSVWGWIVQRRKELQKINEKILLMTETGNSADHIRSLSQKEQLEHSLAKRYHQRERILQEIRKLKLTTPYKDIARLLNTTVGTVGSRIFRLREQIAQEFGEKWTSQERAL